MLDGDKSHGGKKCRKQNCGGMQLKPGCLGKVAWEVSHLVTTGKELYLWQSVPGRGNSELSVHTLQPVCEASVAAAEGTVARAAGRQVEGLI